MAYIGMWIASNSAVLKCVCVCERGGGKQLDANENRILGVEGWKMEYEQIYFAQE